MLKVLGENLEGIRVNEKEMKRAVDDPFKISGSAVKKGLKPLYRRGNELGLEEGDIYNEAYLEVTDAIFTLRDDLWKQNMEVVKAQSLIRELEKTRLGRFCLKRAFENIKV